LEGKSPHPIPLADYRNRLEQFASASIYEKRLVYGAFVRREVQRDGLQAVYLSHNPPNYRLVFVCWVFEMK
jgi:hypothetical protein